MTDFILFIKGGTETNEDYTPEEMQAAVARYSAWARQLAADGKLVSAFKLRDDGGRLLSARDGQIAVDSPLPETKETIGGYFVITAADYDEAVTLASGCPTFSRGGMIELRQIEE